MYIVLLRICLSSLALSLINLEVPLLAGTMSLRGPMRVMVMDTEPKKHAGAYTIRLNPLINIMLYIQRKENQIDLVPPLGLHPLMYNLNIN